MSTTVYRFRQRAGVFGCFQCNPANSKRTCLRNKTRLHSNTCLKLHSCMMATALPWRTATIFQTQRWNVCRAGVPGTEQLGDCTRNLANTCSHCRMKHTQELLVRRCADGTHAVAFPRKRHKRNCSELSSLLKYSPSKVDRASATLETPNKSFTENLHCLRRCKSTTVLVDVYSKWIEVFVMPSTTTAITSGKTGLVICRLWQPQRNCNWQQSTIHFGWHWRVHEAHEYQAYQDTFLSCCF